MIRLIVWIFIIYVFIKVAKSVIRIFSGSAEPKEPIQNNHNNENTRKSYSIDQKDIVDADFTEIKEDKDKKTGE